MGERVEIDKNLYDELVKFLDHMCNSTGQLLTEYHWRETAYLHARLVQGDDFGKDIDGSNTKDISTK